MELPALQSPSSRVCVTIRLQFMPVEKSHYPLLGAICASLFSTPLMMAGINAILPEVGITFQASGAQLGLVGACYSLGLAVFQLLAGSMGDIYGHRRIFLIGAVLFGVTSAIGAISTALTPFLIMRFGQGVGGALLSASGLALLASSAQPENRTAYLAFSGVAVYAGLACGPPFAGFITSAIGWRWLFWINTFCCVLVFLAMQYAARQNWRPAPSKPFDWSGAACYAFAMTGLTIAAAQLNRNNTLTCAGFIIFAGMLALFVIREKKAPFPVLNLSLLKANPVLRRSALAAFVNYSSLFGLLFYFSFFLQVALHKSVAEAGLVLGIQAVAQIAITPFANKLCKNYPIKYISACGSAICGAGLLTAAFLTPVSPLWLLVAAQIFLGAGISMFSLANTALILESGGKQGIGQTAAITGAVRTAGQLISMIFVTVSVALFLGSNPIDTATLAGFMHSMKSSLMIFGFLNLAAIACAFARNKNQSQTQ